MTLHFRVYPYFSAPAFSLRTIKATLLAVVLLLSTTITLQPAVAGVKSRTDLEYGVVLFEYYQKDYFSALVEHAVATEIANKAATSHKGLLLKGGMSLSYGMADSAKTIFDALLAQGVDENTRNRAWYYLAKLYHARSQPELANSALEKIHGNIPADLHLDYHYLATLIHNDGEHLSEIEKAVDNIPTTTPQYPYLMFNLGVSYLQGGDQLGAIRNLEIVLAMADESEELQVLADRARHGLAQLALEERNLFAAWNHLTNIRTTGLYSSRALLAYAWAAIGQKQYEVALPALQMLNDRSIALPEVQEGKVLLGHLYEQQGSMTRALKSHLEAEQKFIKGVAQVAEARRIIDMREVPREFIDNLEAIVEDTDWYGTQPSVDYQKLTPFLVDLMASNAFNQVLYELADLYALRDNLAEWSEQIDQHKLILEQASKKSFDKDMEGLLNGSEALHRDLQRQREELGLKTLVFDSSDKERFNALLENTSKDLVLLDDKIRVLQKNKAPYVVPVAQPGLVKKNHERIAEQQKQTEHYIALLEPVMRSLVKVELDKHEERMRYYLAQSRLAKARLYDTALIKMDAARGGASGAGE